MYFWNSLVFSMKKRMLAVWSLVPLPFLNSGWTSGSSWFMYCWRGCLLWPVSHAGKVMLKILQARLQPYVNHELPDVQAGLRKGRGTRDQTDNIQLIIKKQEFQKNIYFCFIDNQNLWLCGSQESVKNSSRDGNTRPPDLPPEKSLCRSRSNS